MLHPLIKVGNVHIHMLQGMTSWVVVGWKGWQGVGHVYFSECTEKKRDREVGRKRERGGGAGSAPRQVSKSNEQLLWVNLEWGLTQITPLFLLPPLLIYQKKKLNAALENPPGWRRVLIANPWPVWKRPFSKSFMITYQHLISNSSTTLRPLKLKPHCRGFSFNRFKCKLWFGRVHQWVSWKNWCCQAENVDICRRHWSKVLSIYSKV